MKDLEQARLLRESSSKTVLFLGEGRLHIWTNLEFTRSVVWYRAAVAAVFYAEHGNRSPGTCPERVADSCCLPQVKGVSPALAAISDQYLHKKQGFADPFFRGGQILFDCFLSKMPLVSA